MHQTCTAHGLLPLAPTQLLSKHVTGTSGGAKAVVLWGLFSISSDAKYKKKSCFSVFPTHALF